MSIQRCKNRFFHWIALMVCVALPGCTTSVQMDQDWTGPEAELHDTFYAFKLKDIDGWPVALSRYKGQVVLVVNVASECRYSDQYRNLQRLYMKYKDQGFVVLGFPANNFANQEPGTNADIKEFTSSVFNVQFPMFSKISVKGEDTHPLYQCLTSPQASGDFAGPITWNFNKFLIDKTGKTVARFGSEVDPLASQVTEAIEAALK